MTLIATKPSQSTFAATTSTVLRSLDEPELGSFGVDLMDANDVVDKLYDVYIALLAKNFFSVPGDYVPETAGRMLTEGLYFPACERTYLTGQVDLRNDTIPDYACFPVFNNPVMIGVVAKTRFPRGVMRPCPGTELRVGFLARDLLKHVGGIRQPDSMDILSRYLVLKADRRIIPAVYSPNARYSGDLRTDASFSHVAACGINIWNDRRHLWQVRTEELLFASPTPIGVGCTADHIKSLFYARTLPITAAGRKRPIMHWVEAHQRRLKNGTDIDVVKHLRGIDKFEMGGFAFSITNPVKPTPRRGATP